MRLEWNGSQFLILGGDVTDKKFSKLMEMGFDWNCATNLFFTTKIQVAAQLRKYATDAARVKLNCYLIDETPWLGRIRWPQGQQPLSFQVPAAYFALDRNRSYCGADPGMGKTIIAALASNAMGPDWLIYYVCPPYLVFNVEAELKAWDVHGRRISILKPDGPTDLNAHIHIVPDSIIWRKELRNYLKPDLVKSCLIIDEAHRMNRAGSKRTKSVLAKDGIAKLFKKVIWLSGTPMPNRPMDLYTILSRQAPETIGFRTRMEYGFRYCGPRYDQEKGIWIFKGASNLDELARNVHGVFMNRLRKEDHLQLKGKRREVIIIGEQSKRLSKFERAAAQEWGEPDRDLESEPIATYRREVGEEKLPDALNFILDEIEIAPRKTKFVIYAFHKKVIRQLEKSLRNFKPYVIRGGVSKEARNEIVRGFQKNPSRRVLIGQVQTMLGFTLTKGTRGIFVEWSWVPGENNQAEDRLHRIGQNADCLFQYLVLKNSLDKVVLESELRKRENTAKI